MLSSSYVKVRPGTHLPCYTHPVKLQLCVNGSKTTLALNRTACDEFDDADNDDDDDDACAGVASEHQGCCTLMLNMTKVAQRARRYNGYYELYFTLELRTPYERQRNLIALVRFPWSTLHYLGPLVRGHAVPSARFVAQIPSTLELFVCVDLCLSAQVTAPLPSEMLLKEHVKTILDHDEFCGSMASAYLQNIVRDMPFYLHAMQRYSNWSQFVRYFATYYGSWVTLMYSRADHARLGLSELTPSNELRLVSNRHVAHYEKGDQTRDHVKLAALLDCRQLLSMRGVVLRAQDDEEDEEEEETLVSNAGGGTPLSRETLTVLGASHSFHTLNCVNYLQTLKLMARGNYALFSPLHPIQIDRPGAGLTTIDVYFPSAPRCHKRRQRTS